MADVKKTRVLARAREVIRKEAEGIAKLESKLNDTFAKAVKLLLNCKGRVIVTGMGKSGIIGKKIASTFNSIGTPASFLHPVEGVHGDLGLVRKEDVVLAISKSGDTAELYQLFPIFKRIGVPIIALLGNMESPISKESDIVIDVSVDGEAGPYDLVPTISATAALVMGDCLALALFEKRNFSPEDFALLHPGGNLGRKLLKVKDLMHTGERVPIVSENTGLKETILEMTTKRFGATTVADAKGRLVGIFTDGDLRRLIEGKRDFLDLTAKDVMTKNPKTIAPDEFAAVALNKMESHKITCLVITDSERKPHGLIHLHDLLEAKVM
jgi:arabinose-5-phosphate isomerase